VACSIALWYRDTTLLLWYCILHIGTLTVCIQCFASLQLQSGASAVDSAAADAAVAAAAAVDARLAAARCTLAAAVHTHLWPHAAAALTAAQNSLLVVEETAVPVQLIALAALVLGTGGHLQQWHTCREQLLRLSSDQRTAHLPAAVFASALSAGSSSTSSSSSSNSSSSSSGSSAAMELVKGEELMLLEGCVRAMLEPIELQTKRLLQQQQHQQLFMLPRAVLATQLWQLAAVVTATAPQRCPQLLHAFGSPEQLQNYVQSSTNEALAHSSSSRSSSSSTEVWVNGERERRLHALQTLCTRLRAVLTKPSSATRVSSTNTMYSRATTAASAAPAVMDTRTTVRLKLLLEQLCDRALLLLDSGFVALENSSGSAKTVALGNAQLAHAVGCTVLQHCCLLIGSRVNALVTVLYKGLVEAASSGSSSRSAKTSSTSNDPGESS
jgi:hypothetical protein